jgi:hypothetical protein
MFGVRNMLKALSSGRINSVRFSTMRSCLFTDVGVFCRTP